MKFIYKYRTRDNVQHEGTIDVPDKDAAYAALKKQGIRPINVCEAPGFFNKLMGSGKRWFVLFVLAILAVVAIASVYYAVRTKEAVRETLSDFDRRTRRQPIGDTAVIEKGIKTGWTEVFPEAGERFLASFAIPGVMAGIRTTSEDEVRASLSRRIASSSNDPMEVRQIKAMVEGMKDELRRFLADGGTIVEYGNRLVARQEQELGYYNRAKNEIESLKNSGASEQAVTELWETRNAALRRMGIRLVSLPE